MVFEISDGMFFKICTFLINSTETIVVGLPDLYIYTIIESVKVETLNRTYYYIALSIKNIIGTFS